MRVLLLPCVLFALTSAQTESRRELEARTAGRYYSQAAGTTCKLADIIGSTDECWKAIGALGFTVDLNKVWSGAAATAIPAGCSSQTGTGFMVFETTKNTVGTGRNNQIPVCVNNTPTKMPTAVPTTPPSKTPSACPTSNPSTNPTMMPTSNPTMNPSSCPTSGPTKEPTDMPSAFPTKVPTNNPTVCPTKNPTRPTMNPTMNPTKEPVDITVYADVAGVDENNAYAVCVVIAEEVPGTLKECKLNGETVTNPAPSRRRLQNANIEAIVTVPEAQDTSNVNTDAFTTAVSQNSNLPAGVTLNAASTAPFPVNPGPISGSSHGDPIIHTFKGECYDLNKDGLYLASSHPKWNHKVKVAVYNNFIREIQITDKNDEIFWSVSNLNEVTGSWKYGLTFKNRMCNKFSWKECEFDHEEYTFDAQVFNFKVQILFHTYLDDGIEEGGRGIHLDIYPTIYHKRRKNFNPSEYDGIYFDNPHPEELAFCPADAHKRV